ncbi:hypothetical protein [Flaviflexus equikiangi]|uniref:Uncharacterized protein n=1 Tax=Flaviflexus equikiangi TaxID=2758573 RepID=A0ABS2TFT7_9ACTO|nr:hypothetical protein [Flaviflexus equikiangi]MBM9433516.1 hypothetical protein [Flaviflexus equikiangi]
MSIEAALTTLSGSSVVEYVTDGGALLDERTAPTSAAALFRGRAEATRAVDNGSVPSSRHRSRLMRRPVVCGGIRTGLSPSELPVERTARRSVQSPAQGLALHGSGPPGLAAIHQPVSIGVDIEAGASSRTGH